MQDSIDLFLGNYAVEEADWTTPIHDPKDWKFLTVRKDKGNKHMYYSPLQVFDCDSGVLLVF